MTWLLMTVKNRRIEEERHDTRRKNHVSHIHLGCDRRHHHRIHYSKEVTNDCEGILGENKIGEY